MTDTRRELCEGYDDPEERCPRHPDDCICWKGRVAPDKPAPSRADLTRQLAEARAELVTIGKDALFHAERVKVLEAELESALTGDWFKHHIRALAQVTAEKQAAEAEVQRLTNELRSQHDC